MPLGEHFTNMLVACSDNLINEKRENWVRAKKDADVPSGWRML